ncbi:hypothetical protein CHARACLAT_007401 [Characodon lateralis]|uniref:Uncharacterized protein n=1 Tax=Characodon lateralis TaxID=208331 RepID=A0ABU7DPS0_9TELE|nr:hypothetical protein [Characodon lateralis]
MYTATKKKKWKATSSSESRGEELLHTPASALYDAERAKPRRLFSYLAAQIQRGVKWLTTDVWEITRSSSLPPSLPPPFPPPLHLLLLQQQRW